MREVLAAPRPAGAQIARALRLSRATVARYLRPLGLARLRALEPAEPVQRYEWDRPGDLVHLDIKKLGRIGRIGHRITGDRRARVRGIGWEYVHVAVDDATRLAYVEVLPDEQGVLARPARPDVNATGRLVPLRLDERLRGHAVHFQGPSEPL